MYAVSQSPFQRISLTANPGESIRCHRLPARYAPPPSTPQPSQLTPPEHPGGPKIIVKYAGKDATEEFEPIHPPDTLDKYLPKDKHLGPVDMATVAKEVTEESPEEKERLQRVKEMPLLEQCYNLLDFEAVARRVMKKTAWGYYSSAADDEIVCYFPLPPYSAVD